MNVSIKKIEEFIEGFSLKKTIGNDFQHFLDEVTLINWLRLKLFGTAAVIIFLALIFVDIIYLKQGNWDDSIGYSILFFSHISILLFLSVTIGFTWFEKTKSIEQISHYHANSLRIILLFCMGNLVAITIGDVLINGTIVAYIGTIFLVAAIYIMTNVFCFILFGFNFFLMFYMLNWVEKTNGMDMTTQSINASTFTIFAIILSRIIYYTHGKDYKNRSIIELQKKELDVRAVKAQQYFDVAEVMMLYLDRNQNVIQINMKGCEILEYTKDEILGQNWFDNFLPKKNIEGIKNLFEKFMSGEKRDINYYEKSILTKSGNEKIIAWHDSIIKDNAGDVQGVLTSGEDITQRRKVETALEKSEEKFRTAFITSPNAITITSVEDGTYIDINNTFTKLLGYSPEDVIGKSALELNIWNDPKDREQLVAGLHNNGIVNNLEAKFIGKDGQTMIGLMSARILDIENVNYLLANTQDITDLKTTQKAMRLMKYGVDHASDCIFYMNSDARFIYVNNSACELLGYTYEELLSMNLKQVDTKISLNGWADRFAELKHIKSDRFESQHLTKSGKIIPVEITSSYMEFEDKEGIFSFSRDISEQKQTEKDKAHTQKIISEQNKLALVGQIAGKMAHDFNNVLAVIMGNAQLALLDSKEEKTIKALELIFNQTIRGKNLTRNLVAFAKDQEPKQEFFRLNGKIDLVLNLLKKDLQGVELINENMPGVPDLLADSGMIEHALVNLIQNSIHATSMVEQPCLIIRTFHQDKNIYFEIKDNGCGIPEEVLDRIYEPGFTMKGNNDITNSYKPGIEGTGYGMANIKKYIEQHKGNIVIDSNIGKGTKITISFPVIKKELTKKEIIEIKKGTIYFEKYILLVEDESAISDVQYKILTHEPCAHKVDIAATGQMAVDLFNRNKYDFVSLDYILPGELNGMDVYKHIRQTNDTIPILFVSGNLDFLESTKELKLKDPCVDHVSKPCQNKDYVRAINDLLEHALAE